MAITRAQQAKQMLRNGGMSLQEAKDMAPKGEFLAYINSKEAKMLKDAGGSGVMTKAGIPSFVEYGGASGFESAKSTGSVRGDVDRGRDTGSDYGQFDRVVERKRKQDLRDLAKRTADEKLEEKLEKFRDLGGRQRKLSSFMKKFSPLANIASTFGPLNNRDFFLDKVLDSQNSPFTKEVFANLSEEDKEEVFDKYMSQRMAGKIDAFGREIEPNRDGGGIIPMIPTNVATPLPSPKIIEPSPFNILPARITGSIFDFSNMAEGGRIQAMDGGIMDLGSARQMMFLGGIAKSIGKGLKSVTRAAKKVFKSPVGKAALLGLGAYYAPGFGIKATGGFSKFAKPGGFLSKILTEGGDKALTLDNLSGLKLAGLLTATPFLFGSSDDKDDVPPTNLGPVLTREQMLAIRANPFETLTPRIVGTEFAANGGRIGYQEGSKEPVAKKTMPLLDMDGKEMDLREEGGFVPIGRMEKADDVPARLSKNEFVFTADAVRNAGDGDVDKGAEVMYNMMKNLEAGGKVSEESQGLKGARRMFETSQRLEEVL